MDVLFVYSEIREARGLTNPTSQRSDAAAVTVPGQTFTAETVQIQRPTTTLLLALSRPGIAAADQEGPPLSSVASGAWRQRKSDTAAVTLPDVESLVPRMLDINERRFRTVLSYPRPARAAFGWPSSG
jgi:hypothetical protein